MNYNGCAGTTRHFLRKNEFRVLKIIKTSILIYLFFT